MKRHHYTMIWPALAVVLLDQISKILVVHYLRVQESLVVIAGFFNLVHIRNRGMAFGIMSRPDTGLASLFLLATTLVAVILLLLWFLKLKENEGRIAFGISLILGGAVGNLVDRLRFREVIDFLDLYLGPYHWPAFNVADSAITVGTFWLVISLIFLRSSK